MVCAKCGRTYGSFRDFDDLKKMRSIPAELRDHASSCSGGRVQAGVAVSRSSPGASSSTSETVHSAMTGGFRVGNDVIHPTFGEGVVVEIRGDGLKAEATIQFSLVGTKVLSLAWTPLKFRRDS